MLELIFILTMLEIQVITSYFQIHRYMYPSMSLRHLCGLNVGNTRVLRENQTVLMDDHISFQRFEILSDKNLQPDAAQKPFASLC